MEYCDCDRLIIYPHDDTPLIGRMCDLCFAEYIEGIVFDWDNHVPDFVEEDAAGVLPDLIDF